MLRFMCTILVVAVLLLGGCASPMPVGIWYTGVTLPAAVGSNEVPQLKTGCAKCQSFLTLIAAGDASIGAAMRNGGITEIHHVDYDVKNFFGFYGEYTTIVYGR